MSLAILRKVGGSTMVAIPTALLDELGMRPNTKVDMSVDHGKLVIEPSPKTSYTLAELVAQCNAKAPMTEEEKEWLSAAPVRDEEI